MLGLRDDFMVAIIRQVGNYGEIFDRNLRPLKLSRGVNSLWTAGGLLYAPPFRQDARPIHKASRTKTLPRFSRAALASVLIC